MVSYVLHYAPDNASMIVRLVLEELGVPYDTRLVDRSTAAQRSDAYRAINPTGRIPALETPDGPLFETAAIVLWLADRHRDRVSLFPAPQDAMRGIRLSWLFFLSNTLHSDQRHLFHPEYSVGPDPAAQAAHAHHVKQRLIGHFGLLNEAFDTGALKQGPTPTICDFYAATLLRWCAIYPEADDRRWFRLSAWPALQALAETLDTRESTHTVSVTEGLGPAPFSTPQIPNPPEGSAR